MEAVASRSSWVNCGALSSSLSQETRPINAAIRITKGAFFMTIELVVIRIGLNVHLIS